MAHKGWRQLQRASSFLGAAVCPYRMPWGGMWARRAQQRCGWRRCSSTWQPTWRAARRAPHPAGDPEVDSLSLALSSGWQHQVAVPGAWTCCSSTKQQTCLAGRWAPPFGCLCGSYWLSKACVHSMPICSCIGCCKRFITSAVNPAACAQSYAALLVMKAE